MKIKASQLIADLKANNQKTMEKKVYVRRADFKDFCRCACPYDAPREFGKCVACPVGILEDHDNKVRQELYEDIRNMILG